MWDDSNLVNSRIGTLNCDIFSINYSEESLKYFLLVFCTSHRCLNRVKAHSVCNDNVPFTENSTYPSMSCLHALTHIILTITHWGLIDEDTEAQRSQDFVQGLTAGKPLCVLTLGSLPLITKPSCHLPFTSCMLPTAELIPAHGTFRTTKSWHPSCRVVPSSFINFT